MEQRRQRLPNGFPGHQSVPIGERITAIADAGFCGFGLIADDLIAIREDISFEALRDMISEAGLVHTEIELLERWWIPRGKPGHTYDVRELVEAADVLAPVQRQDRLEERAGDGQPVGTRRPAI